MLSRNSIIMRMADSGYTTVREGLLKGGGFVVATCSLTSWEIYTCTGIFLLHSIHFTAQVAGNAYPCCRLPTGSTSLHHQKPFVLFLAYTTLSLRMRKNQSRFAKPRRCINNQKSTLLSLIIPVVLKTFTLPIYCI